MAALEAQRLKAASSFAVEAAQLAANTRGQNVVVLDVSGISPITDFFVLVTGTSARQMRSVCDELRELGETRNFQALSSSGYEGESWILVDFVDVVVHLFSHEARLFYDLDGLWGDAPRVAWEASKP